MFVLVVGSVPDLGLVDVENCVSVLRYQVEDHLGKLFLGLCKTLADVTTSFSTEGDLF